MSKWIAEFELEDGDTMPEHMDLHYKGAKIDFHCKPLEQEPFINKPCVSSGVCEHDKNRVLDKIRAEIAEYGSIMVSYAITKDTKTDKGIEKLVSGVLKEAKEQVLEIIDKYKADSDEE